MYASVTQAIYHLRYELERGYFSYDYVSIYTCDCLKFYRHTWVNDRETIIQRSKGPSIYE